MAYSFTDDNVPLKCPECDTYLEGINETVSHIIEFHPDYFRDGDAVRYAEQWIEKAHDDQREQLADYYDQRKIDRAMGD